MKNKFNLGAFDSIAKVNAEIEKEEQKVYTNTTKTQKKPAYSDDDIQTQEVSLQSLNLNVRVKDLKVQKSLALKKSTIARLSKLATKFDTSISDIADKAIRAILQLKN